MTEDEMVAWNHRVNGHEFEQILGDSEGQGSLACCSSWGHRVGHDWLNNNKSHHWFMGALGVWIELKDS